MNFCQRFETNIYPAIYLMCSHHISVKNLNHIIHFSAVIEKNIQFISSKYLKITYEAV